MCTFNLHVAVCHLRSMELAHGAIANLVELWIERLIQV